MQLFSIKDIQIILGNSCLYKGNVSLLFDGFKPVIESSINHLSWIRPKTKKAAYYINHTQAGGIICDEATFGLYSGSMDSRLFIITANPLLAFAKILAHFQDIAKKENPELIHPTAIIHRDCRMGTGVRVGAYSIIDACTIGDDTVIGNNVRIFENVVIGTKCHIREFCSIGGAGFGITQDENGNNIHVPHVGRAVIGNHVLLFPYCNIDIGMLGDTIIEDHVVIDHYCHIGHNTFTGKNTIITAGAVLAGGAKVGNNCFLGLHTIVKEKVEMGPFVTSGMGSVVTKNIPGNETWIGNPAMEIKSFIQQRDYLKKKGLPEE